MTALPAATPGTAVSVQAPKGGLQSATTVAEVTFNLSAWAGLYVKVVGHGADHYLVCHNTPAGVVIDPTTATLVASAPLATAPDYDAAGLPDQWLVDEAKPYCSVRTVAGAGFFRIRRS